MKFTGACIDGPWLGRNVTSQSPYFYIAEEQRTVILDGPPSEPMAPTTFKTIEYRWNHRLKVWSLSKGPGLPQDKGE